MYPFRRLFVGLLAWTLTAALADGADKAVKTEVKATNTWSGSLEDEKLQKEAPESGVITSQKAFEKLWTAWKVGDKVPKIDFEKELVLIATTRGSKLSMNARLDDKGNLTAPAIATRDLRPGFRYQIITVKREGVKTFDGKDLPKEKE